MTDNPLARSRLEAAQKKIQYQIGTISGSSNINDLPEIEDPLLYLSDLRVINAALQHLLNPKVTEAMNQAASRATDYHPLMGYEAAMTELTRETTQGDK